MFEAVSTKNNIERIYLNFIVFIKNKNKNNIIRCIKVIKRAGWFIYFHSLSYKWYYLVMFSVFLEDGLNMIFKN